MNQQSPHLQPSNQSLLADVIDEITERLNRGDVVDVEEYALRYPQVQEPLRKAHKTLLRVCQIKDATPGPASLSLDLLPLQQLGDFRILRELGRGGMGVVYEAEQLSLGRRVALKTLPFAAILDPRQLKRFRNEAQAAATLKHPNIVGVHAVGSERGVHYFAMELIHGPSLAEVVQSLRGSKHVGAGQSEISFIGRHKSGRTDASSVGGHDDQDANNGRGVRPTRIGDSSETKDTQPIAALSTAHSVNRTEFFRCVTRLAIQAAEALQYAHEEGVIHRDIKPSNLLIDSKGKLWITDFGLAQFQSGQDLTVTGDLMGTLRYMSPEQAEGKKLIDHRVDVYALAITLYELLTLRPAFTESRREKLLSQVIQQEPPWLRTIDGTIPKDLETIVLKASAKEASNRYDSVGELADDLRRYLDQKPIRARRVASWERGWRWAKRNPGVALLGTAVACLLAFLAVAGPLAAVRERALASERQLYLYVSDVNSAFQAWEQGNLDRVRELLSRHVPRRAGADDLRGFEWHYLWSEYQQALLGSQYDHEAAVRTLALSLDGTTMATGGDDGTVKLWDLRVGRRQLINVLADHGERVNSVAYSPDGQWLAVGSFQHPVVVWSMSTGERAVTLGDRVGATFSVSFSPSGAWLANSVSSDSRSPQEIRVWSTHDWSEKLVLSGHKGDINSVAFSADESMLATASSDRTVKVWDLGTGKPLQTLDQQNEVFAVRFSLDGQMLASAGFNYETRIWDTSTWIPRATSRQPGHSVTSLAFSPDGAVLATAGRDRTARLWDVPTGRMSATINGHASDLTSLEFSRDGKTLATGSLDGTARLWDVAAHNSQQPADVHGQWKTTIAIAPDGRRIAAVTGLYRREAGGEPGGIRMWQIANGERSVIQSPDSYFMCAAYSPDGGLLATGGHLVTGGQQSGLKQGQIQLWSSADGTELATLAVGKNVVYSLAFSPDGNTLASGDMDGSVLLWDVTGRQVRHELQKPASESYDGVTCVKFSPDGALLAAAMGRSRRIHNDWSDCVVRVWDTRSGQLMATLASHADLAMALDFSPDGAVLASGGRDDTIKLWDLAHPKHPKTILAHSLYVLSLAFSPDGRTLASASADATVKLWNVATGDELCTLERPVTATSVAFTPDGLTLVAGHTDKSVRLWHATPSKQVWPVVLE